LGHEAWWLRACKSVGISCMALSLPKPGGWERAVTLLQRQVSIRSPTRRKVDQSLESLGPQGRVAAEGETLKGSARLSAEKCKSRSSLCSTISFRLSRNIWSSRVSC